MNVSRFKPVGAMVALATFNILATGTVHAVTPPPTVYVSVSTGVDSDTCGTIDHPCKTIQRGVDRANAGDIVSVAAGSYPENVTVNKSVDIKGSGATVVGTSASGTFNITASDVTLERFTISGNAAGPGVQTSATASGYHILHNTVKDNVFGIYLNSNGTNHSDVSHNVITGNNRAGSASGNGIYADQGTAHATVDHNSFGTNSNGDITLVSPATSKVNIDHNSTKGSGILLYLLNGTDVNVDHNSGVNFDTHAVQLDGGSKNVTIDHNAFRGTNGSGVGGWSGIRISAQTVTTPNDNITISANTLRQFGDSGILIGNGSADTTSALTNSNISRNVASNNGGVDPAFSAGILVRAGSTGLMLERNTMRNNTPVDARDSNVTINNWVRNSCGISVPASICH